MTTHAPILATPDKPVTVYYCKANVKTGLTVRILHGKARLDCRGVELSGPAPGFSAEMIHGNSTGPAKSSGARCVLKVTFGIVTPLP